MPYLSSLLVVVAVDSKNQQKPVRVLEKEVSLQRIQPLGRRHLDIRDYGVVAADLFPELIGG
jgi:hypothetical protein